MTSLKKLSTIGKTKRKLADISKDAVDLDPSLSPPSVSSPVSSASGSDSDSGSEDSPTRGTPPDERVLSHAEKRRQKKRKLNSGDAVSGEAPPESHKTSKSKKGKRKKPGEVSEGGDTLQKRQNSVWIGNLAYKSTAVMLKDFFEGLEVTRIHMPLKASPSGTGPKVNSGFAYVDFSTPEAKLVAITMSERNLEGRRLLIKDADDFSGRPTATTATINEDGTTTAAATDLISKSGAPKTSLTKIAQKILAAQKQPPGPTLFFGNLGFQATADSIAQLLEAHRKKQGKAPIQNKGDQDSSDGEEEDNKQKVTLKGKESKKEDRWIRKIRMGTFEDSGNCKGWAFVDFTSTEHATFALVNPRNHSLDGRKLTVEYASPDAVRRGGGPRELWNHKRGVVAETTRFENPRAQGISERREKDRSEKKLKHGLDDERTSAGKGGRPKPGAALALAQRGTAAILPSQGQRITF